MTFDDINSSLQICQILIENNLTNLEVTLRTANSLRCIEAIKKELLHIEDDFVYMLKDVKYFSEGISKEIIEEILLTQLDNSLAKIKRVAIETVEAITQKIEELKSNSSYLDNELVKKAEQKFEEFEKIAGQKVESIKNSETTKKATKEAKKLGNHAWKLAKSIVESALKSAKDVMNK